MAEAAGPSTGATGVNTMAEVKQRPLTQRVETMVSVIELLLETLKDLSDGELKKFKDVLLSQTDFRRRFPESSWMLMKTTDRQDTVFFMVLTYGQQSVETTKEVLKKIKRTDLVQRLSDSSSGPKKKHCVDEHLSALIHKVATMCADKELLLGTLSDLSSEELKMFRWLLQFTLFERNLPHISWRRLEWTDRADELVDVMMEMYGQRSVEVTKEVFMDMNKTDLVQRLLETSSSGYRAAGASAEAFGVDTTEKEKHCVDEHWPALIQKVETMASVIELLLEILKDLSDGELETFKEILLSQTDFRRRFSDLMMLLETIDRQVTVFFMVLTYGQQSVETTKEVLKMMKRTDLVQRLSDSSSGPKKKHSDEHRPALIQRVATVAAVKHLLFETLNDLSNEELEKFKELIVSQKKLPDISLMFGHINRAIIVDQMVQTYGQQSLELTREVVKEMNRTDLMQRLSETSSGLKEKHSVDEHRPALLEKAAARAAVKQILLETLKDLSLMEVKKFKWLLQFTYFQKGLPHISWRELDRAKAQALVDLMVQTCNQQSVEVTKEVFMDMNRTDLVERLSETNSRLKEDQSKLLQETCAAKATQRASQNKRKRQSKPVKREETMTSLQLKLLKTLKDLSTCEHKLFKHFLRCIEMKTGLPRIPRNRITSAGRVGIVELMVQIYGEQALEVTKEVLKEMGRDDLVQRLSETSSGLKEKQSKRLQEKGTTTPLVEKLLETLRDLSDGELEMFKSFLQGTIIKKGLQRISRHRIKASNRVEIVELMVETYGQQSVEVTREVLMEMNKRDLMQKVTDISSGSKETRPKHKEVTMTPLMEKLLETLRDLSDGELEMFKHALQFTKMEKGLPRISGDQMETASRVEIVELMVETYGQQSVEVTRRVLKKMNKRDLMQKVSDISSGSKGPSRSSELEGGGSIKQVSSDWIQLEPEVNSSDEDEAPTYSLQSEAGHFECSVSGLRWVCKESVSFKYQFFSVEEHMERIESLQYLPAGPLIDITVVAGKLDVVYLPHWICIDDNPTILDKFAVLHIDDCGAVVENVSEVTSSHVKLSEPVFSPRVVLMKVGLPVKINCNILLYKTDPAFLTLHVYLIPRDPGLEQILDKRELSDGYKRIRKPHPEKSLKMHNRFILTADFDDAQIYPQDLKLRYESTPNFFEVYRKNPDRDFALKLTQKNDDETVWTCAIRTDEYQSSQITGPVQGEHFVDKHQCELIERVSNIKPILDNLLREKVIQQEDYDSIYAIPTTQDMMRKLCSGPLRAAGRDGKNVFYRILEEKEPLLVSDLKRQES